MTNNKKSEGVNVSPKYIDPSDKSRKYSDEIFFDFRKDHPTDFIKLQPQKFNTRWSIFKGIPVYYAYRFEYLKQRGDDSSVTDWSGKPMYKGTKNRDVIDKIRHILKYGRQPHNLTNLFPPEHLQKMIDISLDRFEEHAGEFSDFDVIMSLPSNSDLNDLIMKSIKKRTGRGTKFMKAPMLKTAYKQLKFYRARIEKMTDKGKSYANSVLKSLNNKTGDVEIKNIPAGVRRYAYGFMKLKKALDEIINGDILLVDDTIGTGSTLKEAERLLKPFTKGDIWCFAFIKDF